jgi:hypothetical protein
MAEESKSVTPPDWISKTLATLDAISGYTYAALAIAAGLILFRPITRFDTELAPMSNKPLKYAVRRRAKSLSVFRLQE